MGRPWNRWWFLFSKPQRGDMYYVAPLGLFHVGSFLYPGQNFPDFDSVSSGKSNPGLTHDGPLGHLHNQPRDISFPRIAFINHHVCLLTQFTELVFEISFPVMILLIDDVLFHSRDI